MARSEALARAQQRYYRKRKGKTRTYIFQVDTEREPDLVAWLESKKPRAQYLRDAIRRDMGR